MNRAITTILISLVYISLAQIIDSKNSPESVVSGYFDAWLANEFESLRNYVHPEFAEQIKEGVIERFKNGQTEGLPNFDPEVIPLIPAYELLMIMELDPFDELGIFPFEVEPLEHRVEGDNKAFVEARVGYDEYSTIILVPLRLHEGEWLIYASANLLALQGITIEMLN